MPVQTFLPQELSELEHMECYYLDYTIASKDAILAASRKLTGSGIFDGMHDAVRLRTCLRDEIYLFKPKKNFPVPDAPLTEYVHSTGKQCITRLLRLMVGLQSELDGEVEILTQVGSAFNEAASADLISATQFRAITKLILVARELRDTHSFYLKENYSTIGADLINKGMRDGSVVGLIGSGYMMNSFMPSLKPHAVSRFVWVNRSKENAREVAKQYGLLQSVPITFHNIEDGKNALQECDYIFAAVLDCGGVYEDCEFINTQCIVDVSYPSLFASTVRGSIYSLRNTFFQKMLREPVSKESRRAVEADLESYVDSLWK